MYSGLYYRADSDSRYLYDPWVKLAVQDGWVRNRRRWLWLRSTVNWNQSPQLRASFTDDAAAAAERDRLRCFCCGFSTRVSLSDLMLRCCCWPRLINNRCMTASRAYTLYKCSICIRVCLSAGMFRLTEALIQNVMASKCEYYKCLTLQLRAVNGIRSNGVTLAFDSGNSCQHALTIYVLNRVRAKPRGNGGVVGGILTLICLKSQYIYIDLHKTDEKINIILQQVYCVRITLCWKEAAPPNAHSEIPGCFSALLFRICIIVSSSGCPKIPLVRPCWF